MLPGSRRDEPATRVMRHVDAPATEPVLRSTGQVQQALKSASNHALTARHTTARAAAARRSQHRLRPAP